MDVQPLIFESVFEPRPWGGHALQSLFGKPLPPAEPIGVSWELANHTRVKCGPVQGRSLHELVSLWGRDLCGRAPLVPQGFPLAVRFLDARRNADVEVAPPDVPGNHRAWYLLRAADGAALYKGLRAGVSRTELEDAVRHGRCLDLLTRWPAREGDCHYLPAGVPHALGRGIVAAEVQTVADTGHVVLQGSGAGTKTIERALQCVAGPPPDRSAEKRTHVANYWTTVTRLLTCEGFLIEKVRMTAGLEQPIPYAEAVVWIVVRGAGRLLYRDRHLKFRAGDSVLLPAALAGARVALDEDSVWLEITIPVPSDLAAFNRPSREALQAPEGSERSPIQIRIDRTGN